MHDKASEGPTDPLPLNENAIQYILILSQEFSHFRTVFQSILMRKSDVFSKFDNFLTFVNMCLLENIEGASSTKFPARIRSLVAPA